MVTFAPLNLVEDAYPSLVNSSHAMDIIFCRNVLMYFSRETAAKVIAKLRDSLVEGGWLFTSATDASRDLFVGMEPLEIEGTVIYQKRPPAAARSMAQPVEALPTRSVQVDQPTPRPLASAEKPPPIVAAPKPADPDHRKLAHRLANEGRLDEALEAVNRAINGDKLDASSYYLRGVILHEQGAHEEAVTSLRKALYLDPNFVIAHFALGNLMIRTGRGRDAQRCFDNVRALLRTRDRDAVLPESDGITAGRLLQILSTMQEAVA